MSAKEIAHLVAEDDRLRQRIDADQKRRREIQLRLSELRCPHAIGAEFVWGKGRRWRIVGYLPCGGNMWKALAAPILSDGRSGVVTRDVSPWSDIIPDPKGDA